MSAPDVVPVAWRFATDGTVFTGPTRAACCRVIGDISIDGEIEPLYSQATVDALQARINELEAQLFVERVEPVFEAMGFGPLPAFPSVRA